MVELQITGWITGRFSGDNMASVQCPFDGDHNGVSAFLARCVVQIQIGVKLLIFGPKFCFLSTRVK
jgi:hypothetical protein